MAMNLGTRLRDERKEAGLTQKNVSRLIHVSEANICQIERDKQRPKDSTLEKFAYLYKVDLYELIGLRNGRVYKGKQVNHKPEKIPEGSTQITNWLLPNAMSKTQYGHISNHRWLELEEERMESQGYDCVIEPDKIGQLALFCRRIG